MARRLLLLITTAGLLSGCGEWGSDEEGPHRAMLLLRADDGRLREFYLGGYRPLEACFDILSYEASSAAGHGDEFWTNSDFSYGGFARMAGLATRSRAVVAARSSQPGAESMQLWYSHPRGHWGGTMAELTPAQDAFVDELVAGGCTPTEAARRAGFQHPPQEAYRLMQKPHVLAAVRSAQNRLIAGSGTNVALKTLLDVMQDVKAPASARVSAAGKMLDAAGHFSSKHDEDLQKPLAEMTQPELEAFIRRCDTIAAKGREPPLIRVTDQAL